MEAGSSSAGEGELTDEERAAVLKAIGYRLQIAFA
jgi:hypothetical protein